MSSFKKTALWILAAEAVVLAALLVTFFVPLPGKPEFRIVQSGSMEPAVPVGSLVAIVPSATYGIGDVVTYGADRGGSIPTTHRIVGSERVDGKLHYQTKGDANEDVDQTLTAHAAVLGKVVATIPRAGYVIDFARNKQGFFFMIVIPAALIMLDEILTIVQTARGMRRREDDETPAPTTRNKKDRPSVVPQPVTAPRMHAHHAGINGYSVVLRPL